MHEHHDRDHTGHDHGDGHAHSHSHGHRHHSHGHSHASASFGTAFALGTTLNLGFAVVELVYGMLSGSVALLADAGHNFGDVLGLMIAWTATLLAERAPSGRYTYGLRSSSILAALLNALILLVTLGVIAVEAAERLIKPASVSGITMMIVAGVGIIINAATVLLFLRGRDHDLNIRAAFSHMASDALNSAGVVFAGALVWLSGWDWIDPLTSLALVGIVMVGTWSLLRESVNLSLQAAPSGQDPAEVAAFLRRQDRIAAIHDLHVWPMSTTETALTVHLVVPSGYPGDQFAADLAAALKERFGIGHATIQIETDGDFVCVLEPSCA